MRSNKRILALILLVLLLIGCNASPEKLENNEAQVMTDIKITASTLLNPDINNRPSPVVIRIYELKSLGVYTESDFYGLFDDYESVLGKDLISSEQFHLNPGDMRIVKNSISPETQYIAVIAAFRDINRAMWRDSIIISAEEAAQLLIFVDKLSISVWKK